VDLERENWREKWVRQSETIEKMHEEVYLCNSLVMSLRAELEGFRAGASDKILLDRLILANDGLVKDKDKNITALQNENRKNMEYFSQEMEYSKCRMDIDLASLKGTLATVEAENGELLRKCDNALRYERENQNFLEELSKLKRENTYYKSALFTVSFSLVYNVSRAGIRSDWKPVAGMMLMLLRNNFTFVKPFMVVF
jgi:hypothetical protein